MYAPDDQALDAAWRRGHGNAVYTPGCPRDMGRLLRGARPLRTLEFSTTAGPDFLLDGISPVV
ncbi:MAG: hypothetical protein LBF83_11590 [Spirochaetaceae bacterium]|nr:hypothetical protein [Spirochaetaceae bacterium]